MCVLRLDLSFYSHRKELHSKESKALSASLSFSLSVVWRLPQAIYTRLQHSCHRLGNSRCQSHCYEAVHNFRGQVLQGTATGPAGCQMLVAKYRRGDTTAACPECGLICSYFRLRSYQRCQWCHHRFEMDICSWLIVSLANIFILQYPIGHIIYVQCTCM